MALPARGSVRDELLKELLVRERNEKFAVVNMLVNMLAAGLQLKPEGVGDMLESYRQELTQERYLPSMLGVARRKAKAKVRQQKQDSQLLKKLDSFTVEDEPVPVKKPPRRR